jgi:hypothetical protein
MKQNLNKFQQLFSIKNTHKIIILGIYSFGSLSLILPNAKKAVFAEVSARHPYQICKKNEKFDGEVYFYPKSRKSVFSVKDSSL